MKQQLISAIFSILIFTLLEVRFAHADENNVLPLDVFYKSVIGPAVDIAGKIKQRRESKNTRIEFETLQQYELRKEKEDEKIKLLEQKLDAYEGAYNIQFPFVMTSDRMYNMDREEYHDLCLDFQLPNKDYSAIYNPNMDHDWFYLETYNEERLTKEGYAYNNRTYKLRYQYLLKVNGTMTPVLTQKTSFNVNHSNANLEISDTSTGYFYIPSLKVNVNTAKRWRKNTNHTMKLVVSIPTQVDRITSR